MFLRLEIGNVSGTLSVWSPDSKYRSPSGRQEYITFSVQPPEFDHIELKTGESFRREANKTRSEKPLITATLTCYSSGGMEDDKKDYHNRLSYMPRREPKYDDPTPSQLFFTYLLPRAEFELLRENVIARHYPTSVTVELESDAIKFGWEPDGSGKEWDTVERRTVKINGIDFQFDFRKTEPDVDDELSEPFDFATFGDPRKVAFALLSRLRRIEQTSGWLLFVAVAAAVIWAWHSFK